MTQKTLLLHVGLNKTGSSSLQTALASNYGCLRDAGILYPKVFRPHRSDAHYGLHKEFSFMPGPTEPIGLRSLHAEIADSQADTVLLSSEYFSLISKAAHAQEVAEEYKDFRVKVVVFLRHHIDWFISLYNQAVKTVAEPPWDPGLANYIDFQLAYGIQEFSYKRLINLFSLIDSEREPILIPYDRPNFVGGSILRTFMEACGLPFSQLRDGLSPERTVNTSLDPRILPVLEQVSRQRGISLEEKAALKARLITSAKWASKPPPEVQYALRLTSFRKVKHLTFEYQDLLDQLTPVMQDTVFHRRYPIPRKAGLEEYGLGSVFRDVLEGALTF